MNRLVNFLGCHARFDHCVTHIKSFTSDATSLAKLVNVLTLTNRDCLVFESLERRVWLARFCVVRLLNVVRHCAVSLERVREGPDWSGVNASVFSCDRFFVTELVERPEVCEAFLATEKCGRKSQLDASRALHRRGLAAVGRGAGSDSRLLLESLLLISGICRRRFYHNLVIITMNGQTNRRTNKLGRSASKLEMIALHVSHAQTPSGIRRLQNSQETAHFGW